MIKALSAVNDNPQPLPPGIPPQFQMKEYIPPPPRPIPNVRSNTIASSKDAGNAAFRQNKFAEAIKMYSISAGLSATRPTFESAQYSRDELSIALCNRSAAYAADNKWIEALVDANAVIGLKRNWTKGHFRKGKALLGLKRYDEAKQAILLGLEFEPANEVGGVY
jgi:translocation protein SEC72